MRQFVSKPSVIAVSVVAVLAFVGGGIAHAATSSATIKVCVTSKNVVRSADAKGKCPKKTKAVAINKVGPVGMTGPQGPTGGQGAAGTSAAVRTVASGTAATVSHPAYSEVQGAQDGGDPPAIFPIGKVNFVAPKDGFYTLTAYSEISGADFDSSPPEVGCSGNDYRVDTGVLVRVDGRNVGSLNSYQRSVTESAWLEAGAHTFDIRFGQYACTTGDSFGTFSFEKTHLQVDAN